METNELKHTWAYYLGRILGYVALFFIILLLFGLALVGAEKIGLAISGYADERTGLGKKRGRK